MAGGKVRGVIELGHRPGFGTDIGHVHPHRGRPDAGGGIIQGDERNLRAKPQDIAVVVDRRAIGQSLVAELAAIAPGNVGEGGPVENELVIAEGDDAKVFDHVNPRAHPDEVTLGKEAIGDRQSSLGDAGELAAAANFHVERPLFHFKVVRRIPGVSVHPAPRGHEDAGIPVQGAVGVGQNSFRMGLDSDLSQLARRPVIVAHDVGLDFIRLAEFDINQVVLDTPGRAGAGDF